ncbi:hypothetical protein BDY21DRAFT_360029 [Lineolata rhizophorae]|uniref:Uncharacterized protein n=1 Tax=Lineolata rhizophorae TaxID=578093 RepID=A0A6A6PE47_9PEZI|nr:hypothetical protein BDY21DRAFT_360029 [Lineolata rhizophorae]
MRSLSFALACTTSLLVVSAFEYSEHVPMAKRQAPGTPEYECHADCGGIITMSREDGYCEDPEFEPTLESCLECALEMDIWQYYGDSVSEAAEGCGVDATPSPVEETPDEPASTSASGVEVSTSTSVASEAVETSSSISMTLSSMLMTSTAESTPSETEAAASEPAPTSTMESFDGAGNRLSGNCGALVVGSFFSWLLWL